MLVGWRSCRHQRIQGNDMEMWRWWLESGVHETEKNLVSCLLAIRKLDWKTFREQEAAGHSLESLWR